MRRLNCLSWRCYTSAFSIALDQARITLARLPDRWASGSGQPTRNISSSLLDICRDTKSHGCRRCRLIGDSVLLTILVLIFGRSDVFVWILGFFSLGLESTLPLPQFFRLVTFLLKHCPLLILV